MTITHIAHWSSSVQKVKTPDNAIETGVKRFSQILKKKKNIAHQQALGVMASMSENTFTPLHIPVLVKSKLYVTIVSKS